MIWPFKRWTYLGYTVGASSDGYTCAYKLYKKGNRRKIERKFRFASSNRTNGFHQDNNAKLLEWLVGSESFPRVVGRGEG